MKVSRTYTNLKGKTCERTDKELVECFLTGWIDYYSGGEIEHLRRELDNLREATAEALVFIGGDRFINWLEDHPTKGYAHRPGWGLR